MKKKKIMIFPYDSSLIHMIFWGLNMKEYELAEVVSLKSWGYCGIDAGERLGLHTGLMVSDNFYSKLETVDAVFMADTKISLNDDLVNHYKEYANKVGKEFLDFRIKAVCKKEDAWNKKLFPDKLPELYDIKVPLVIVVGTGENVGKFDAQMYVRNAFLNKGYKVSQIGSKPYCELWGFHSFPDFMRTNFISNADKIVMFNHYVNHIVAEEQSDAVVIGVPGGVAPISDKRLDDFGIMNYMVANAVKPDYVVLNMGCVDYNIQYRETLSKVLLYRLNYNVDSVFLANTYINWEATDTLDQLVYLTLPVSKINAMAKDIDAYSIYDKENVEMFKNQILETLTGYGTVEAI